ncbi:F-box domain containing protein [Tanacetum coccineum]
MMDIRLASPPNLPKFHLPNTLLSASSLTYLRLQKCELPSSLKVSIVKLKSLRLLTLSCLRLNEGVIEYLTKGCPLLEEIYLANCYGYKTFCVKRNQNLLKVEIACDTTFLLERIDIEAPNLSYFSLISHKDKAPSMFLDSCKKLTTFCYRGFPLTRFNDFLSKFQFLENVALYLTSHVNNLKLSNHSLRKIQLPSHCDLDEIDLNAPNLLFFEYCDQVYFHDFTPLSREDSYLSKGCMMKCDILWFKKLREFLEKNSIFKVLKLAINWHVEMKSRSLRKSRVYVALLDVVFWCFRPQSLTLKLGDSINKCDVVKFTYEKLLQQEGEGQTNIKFVLISDFVCEQQLSGLNSLLKALSLGRSSSNITFIKEEGGANSSGVMVVCIRLKEAATHRPISPSRVGQSLCKDTFQGETLLEQAIYTKTSRDSTLLIGVYVDDLIITGTPKKDIDKFKAQMEEKFKMSDLGLLAYYLGIEVTQTGGDISIKQTAYANKILKEAGMINCIETLIPMDPGMRLTKITEATATQALWLKRLLSKLTNSQ